MLFFTRVRQPVSPSVGEKFEVAGKTFSMADVAKFAPIYLFHPLEKYFPASIDFLLSGEATSLRHIGPKESGFTVNMLASPGNGLTQEFLGSGKMADPELQREDRRGMTFLQIDPKLHPGQPLGEAPLYVSVQRVPDDSYVILRFISLFAFSGWQAVRYQAPLQKPHTFVARNLCEHQGDMECISVIVSPDLNEIRNVGFEYVWLA